MKKIKSFLQFKTYLTESEIVHIKNSYGGDKTACVLVISRATRRCLLAKKVNQNKWGTVDVKLSAEATTVAELRNETIRELKNLTGYKDEIELVQSYIFVDADKVSHHNYVCLMEQECMPVKDADTSSFMWVTLEDLLGLEEKQDNLVAMLKNDKSFYKYLKRL